MGGKRKWKIIEKIRTLEIIRIVEILEVNQEILEAKKAKEVLKLIEKLASLKKATINGGFFHAIKDDVHILVQVFR